MERLRGHLLAVLVAAFGAAAQEFHVAPAGDDAADGSDAAPFATLERARDAVRAAARGSAPAVVWIHGGDYLRTNAFALSAADSNCVYRAVPGETPRLLGGRFLDPAWFEPVTAASPTWDRLATNARGSVLAVDLAAHGLTNFGTLRARGFGATAVAPMELFINGRAQRLGRWPNTGTWAFVASALSSNRFTYSGSAPSRWSGAEEPWVMGFFYHLWADSARAITNIDTATKTISISPNAPYGIVANQPYYAFNLLEEIDTPGEYYLERDAGLLYLWPPAGFSNAEVVVSLLETSLVRVAGGRDITLDGLDLHAGRGYLAQIDGTNVGLVRCRLSGAGSHAVTISGVSNGLLRCEVADCGSSGVRLDGGSRYTLTEAGNYVRQCVIHDFERLTLTYTPGVSVSGVGQIVERCEIFGAAHSAIIFGGNEHAFELNDIHDVCLWTRDAGAVYCGRDWGLRGNVLRHNFIHDVKSGFSGSYGVNGIYLDDCGSGLQCFGNVLLQVGDLALFNGGGRDNFWENNVVTECGTFHSSDTRGTTRITTNGDSWDLLAKIRTYNYQNPPWSNAYPSLAAIPNDYALIGPYKTPGGTVFSRNVSWSNTRVYSSSGGAFGYYAGMTNNLTNQNPLFVDRPHEDLTLRPGSPALAIPGFQPIPFNRIGPHWAATWDAVAGGPAAQDGNGTWVTGGTNWWDRVPQSWDLSLIAHAVFGATNGAGAFTVTLGGDVALSEITFSNRAYTIAPDTGNLYALTFSGDPRIATLVDGRINARIAGTNGLIKIGAGVLTLGGSNDYGGTTVVGQGTLRLGAAGVIPDGAGKGDVAVNGMLDLHGFSETINGLSGTGTIDTAAGAGATLTVGANDAHSVFRGVIRNATGTLALDKTGQGGLRLPGACSYDGPTTVAQGRLYLDGTHSGTGTITVATNAILAGTGAVLTAATIVQGGGRLGPEATGEVRGLSLADLTLESGAEVGAALAGTNPSLRVTGNLASSPGVLLYPIPLAPLAVGRHVLLAYGGTFSGDSADFTLAAMPNGAQGYVEHNVTNASIDLVITNAGLGLKWHGGTDGQWRIAGPANWKLVSSEAPASFSPFDDVLFDDTAGAHVDVAVVDAVMAGSITVSNDTRDYAWSGRGIGGPGGLVKSGAARLELQDSNSFAGATVVNAGTLAIPSDRSLGVPPAAPSPAHVRLGGEATLEVLGSTTLPVARGVQIGPSGGLGTSTVAVAAGATVTVAGVIAGAPGGTGCLAKAGAGALVLMTNATFAGGVAIYEGRLILSGGSNRLPAGSAAYVGTNGVLDLGGQNLSLATLTGSGMVTGSAGTLAISLAAGVTSRFDGAIEGGTLGLMKTGATNSQFELRGAGSFRGAVSVHTGRLLVAHSLALGTGPKTVNLATYGTLGRPTLLLDGHEGDITLASNISFVTSQAFGAITNLAGDNAILGPFTLTSGGGDTAIAVSGGSLTLGGNMTFNSSGRNLVLTGTGTGAVAGVVGSSVTGSAMGLVKNDTGTWRLTGANTFPGATIINTGTLQVGDGGAGGSLGPGPVTNRSRLVFHLAGTSVVGQAISGTGVVVQAGSGVLAFTAANTYGGGTLVSNGTLLVQGTSGSGTVTVASGATLGGTGTIPRAVYNGGVVAPGASAGILSVGGNYQQTPDAMLAIELAGPSPGVGHDVLAVGGTAFLGGTLSVTLADGYTPPPGSVFTVLTASAVSGTFSATNLSDDSWRAETSSGSLVVRRLTAYQSWALRYGLALDSDPNDPDGDGEANLLEYAHLTDPTNGLSRALLTGEVPADGRLLVRFTRNTNALDITYLVEATGELVHEIVWTGINANAQGRGWSNASYAAEAGATNPVTVTVRDPDPPAPFRNLRLRVTRP